MKICNSCKKPTEQYFIDNSKTITCIACHRINKRTNECSICKRPIDRISKTCISCAKSIRLAM